MPSESEQRIFGKDRDLVRELAREAMELAESPEYEARRRRWCDVNALRKPDRAPVWCRPAGAWREILPEETLECEDPLCRTVERRFRMDFFKNGVGDDHIFPAFWPVRAVFDRDTEYTWGMKTYTSDGSTADGGFHYTHAIENDEDFDRVTVPTYTYNARATDDALNRMQDLLGGVMPVKLVCRPPLGADHSTWLERLRSMDKYLLDMAAQPERIHGLMARFTEAALGAIRAAEDSGVIAPDNDRGMYCSDPIGEPDASGRLHMCNLWGGTNSQEFQSVSPEMTEEFLFRYITPVLEHYGLNHFGCCEDLTQKIDRVLRLPNLRIFVCSFWTDLKKVVEACRGDYCIMWREGAALVTLSDNLQPIRKHMEEGMKILQGHPYQFVLREIETLHGHTRRLHEWARMGIELAQKYS
jgi:hypothetical protein